MQTRASDDWYDYLAFIARYDTILDPKHQRVIFDLTIITSNLSWQKYKRNHAQPRERLELSTPGLQDQCSNHWANEATTNERSHENGIGKYKWHESVSTWIFYFLFFQDYQNASTYWCQKITNHSCRTANLPNQLLNQIYQWEMIATGGYNQTDWGFKKVGKVHWIENKPLKMTF